MSSVPAPTGDSQTAGSPPAADPLQPGPIEPTAAAQVSDPTAISTTAQDSLLPGPAEPAAPAVPAIPIVGSSQQDTAPIATTPEPVSPGNAAAAASPSLPGTQPTTRRWSKAERKRKRMQAVLFLLMSFATLAGIIACVVLYYVKFMG